MKLNDELTEIRSKATIDGLCDHYGSPLDRLDCKLKFDFQVILQNASILLRQRLTDEEINAIADLVGRAPIAQSIINKLGLYKNS